MPAATFLDHLRNTPLINTPKNHRGLVVIEQPLAKVIKRFPQVFNALLVRRHVHINRLALPGVGEHHMALATLNQTVIIGPAYTEIIAL